MDGALLLLSQGECRDLALSVSVLGSKHSNTSAIAVNARGWNTNAENANMKESERSTKKENDDRENASASDRII